MSWSLPVRPSARLTGGAICSFRYVTFMLIKGSLRSGHELAGRL